MAWHGNGNVWMESEGGEDNWARMIAIQRSSDRDTTPVSHSGFSPFKSKVSRRSAAHSCLNVGAAPWRLCSDGGLNVLW